MGYKDCENCGHPSGRGYGFCENCTPKEWIEFNNELTDSKKGNSDESLYFSKLAQGLFLLRNYDSYVTATELYNKNRPYYVRVHDVLTEEKIRSEIRKWLNKINEYVAIETSK